MRYYYTATHRQWKSSPAHLINLRASQEDIHGFRGSHRVVLLFWSCMKGTQGRNDYDPDPFGSSVHVFD